MESKESVWEENSFTKFNIVRICLILFLIWCGIFIFRVSFDYNFFFLITAIFIIIISSCLLLWLLFFEKRFFLIKFTKRTLFIKNRIIMIISKYTLSNIAHIEIILIRKKEWFRIRRGRGWYAMLEFKFRILSAEHQDKIYSFKKINYVPKRG